MVKTIRITTIEELMPLLMEQEYQPNMNRHRSSYVYRGLHNENYKMITSLERNCKHLKQMLEPSILENFTKYAIQEDPNLSTSVWYQLISGQHHGLPTRLMDWSHSPLIALHFAVTEDMANLSDHDCIVWRIDIPEIHSLLPQKYQDAINKSQSKVFSVTRLKEVVNNLSQYDADMGNRSMVIIEPPSTDFRIVNQYSFFSIVPSDITDVEVFLNEHTENSVKYIISKELRWRIRDMLDSLNISERIIYPGLDGLSQWIARHYYVRK